MENKEKIKLNPQQELFCKLYATDRDYFGNGVQAYIEAYDIDISKKGAYKVAQANASRLLSKAIILKKIRELLNLGGLSDERVDKELLFLIEQNAELGTKLGAIKEYNQLQSRIKNKLEVGIDETIGNIKVEIVKNDTGEKENPKS